MVKYLIFYFTFYNHLFATDQFLLNKSKPIQIEKDHHGNESLEIEKLINKMSPVTIEDVDNSIIFKLQSNGQLSLPTTKGFWKIKDHFLIIQTLDGHQSKFSIELKEHKLLIEGVSEVKNNTTGSRNEHYWIINTPD